MSQKSLLLLIVVMLRWHAQMAALRFLRGTDTTPELSGL